MKRWITGTVFLLGSCGLAFGASRDELFDYAKLKAVISNGTVDGHSLRSIEDLLDYFSANQSAILSNYALVYRSRSLQFSSPSFPRVILYSGDGQAVGTNPPDPEPDSPPIGNMSLLFLAFDGDPSSAGADRLEVMSFDGKSAFALKEIHFSKSGVEFNEAPQSCRTCHGAPAKPIWDSYKDWPGVYGSADDFLADAREQSLYQKFLATNASAGRYRHLAIEPNVTLPVLPKVQKYRTRNDEITNILNFLNGKRITAEFLSMPRADAVKPAMKFLMQEPPDVNLASLIAPEVYNATSGLREALHTETKQQAAASYQTKLSRLFRALAEPIPATFPESGAFIDFDSYFADFTSNLRYLAQLAGGNIADWSLALTPEAYAFAGGNVDAFTALQSELEAEGLPHDLYQLQEQSLEATRSLSEQPLPVKPSPATRTEGLDAQAVILRCASCHTDPFATKPSARDHASASYYAFDDVPALRAQLLASGGDLYRRMAARVQASDEAQRMPPPPHRALSSAEINGFLEFLDQAAGG